MSTEKLMKSVEHIARSLAQRYDLDYDLTLAAVKQVLMKVKNLKDMKNINIKEWQKRAGIIEDYSVEEAYLETLEESLRDRIKETLTGLLQEKKKKKAQEPEETIDMDIDNPEGEDVDISAEEPAAPAAPASTPQDVQKELMDALEAAKSIGDPKLQRQISNALTYFTRQQVSQEPTNPTV
jgi:hypothetical protein